MSEQTSQEPTMEEILASIRRIISEDDAPAAEAKAEPPQGDEAPEAVTEEAPAAEAAAEPAPEPAPPPEPEPVAAAPEPAPAAAEDDDELELTDKVETHGDLDVYTPSAPAEPAPAAVAAAAAAPRPVDALVSERAATAASAAFERLSATIAMPAEGRTLEDVVRELLKPLLQQWLDDNLPAIVQQAVEAEVERIARSRVR
jgi:cell pole-organizing protein PopZ